MRRLVAFTIVAGVLLSASTPTWAQDAHPRVQGNPKLGGSADLYTGRNSPGDPAGQTLIRFAVSGDHEPSGQELRLFNGRDLSGWEFFLVDEDAEMEDVWSVEDGILVVKGEPRGYLYTENDFESFRLVVEWRWPETPGNSGVLMRITGEPMMLPNSVEAQLQSGNAGDMYGFQGFRIGGDEERLSEIRVPGWRLAKIEGNENEPGEWNRYEITVDGDRITLILNGKKVNEATRCDVRPGRIGLQSEGGVIHFRTVTLTPLEDR